MVGWALRGVVADLGLPCQRVVNHSGYLSGGWAFGHPDVMQAMLVSEGVPFRSEYTVDLDQCVWDPADEPDDGAGPLNAGDPLRSAAANEVDDLDDITIGELARIEVGSRHDHPIDLDDHQFADERPSSQETGDRDRAR